MGLTRGLPRYRTARGREGKAEFPVERRNAMISGRTPVAKAAFQPVPDAETRRHGERTGSGTRVVRAVNDGHLPPFNGFRWVSTAAKLTRKVSRLGTTAARLKPKGFGVGPHKRRSVWFNPIQNVEPYQGLTYRQ
jgi:hypothetical protein